MKTITIKTQKQFDKLPKTFEAHTIIKIISSERIIINVARGNSSVVAWGNSSVAAWGNSSVVARGNSSVVAWGNSSVAAWGNSSVAARGNSSVEARGNSSVEARGNSSVVARGNSSVAARGNSSVAAWENSSVEARGNSSVVAWENSSVVAWGNSSVVAWGNSSVEARENSSVEARENSSVAAWGNSSVVARGNSSVVAWGRTTIQIFSADSLILLFSFAIAIISKKIKEHKIKKKSKHSYIQYVTDQNWFERNGIKKIQNLILFKRVSCDFKTQEGTDNETLWKVDSTVIHHNWIPAENECGPGKFHAVSRPYFADEFRDKKDDKYIAIKIKLSDIYEWKNNPNYPHKIGFKKGAVLYECDKFGKKLIAEPA